ncbi:MAG TPA: glycolate oxidase subunit GlcE [Sedimenticola sp.]|nr:glycolate oxidase subunit GlcE [Sedimenticola sp.]
MSGDREQELLAAVRRAREGGRPLEIRGSGSKAFYGRAPAGEPLSVAAHRGVVNYEPKELVVTARAGTPLAELEETLAAAGQMLPFEPPRFGPGATLGGTIACGFSGPRRPFLGSARDFVLGVRLINGRGEVLHFGGEVMKNVAGYDISRLMTGALGTLGLLLEVSLKVLPAPEEEQTQVLELDQAEAIDTMNRWAGRPLALSGAAWDGMRLYLRLSGTADAVAAGRTRVGGEPLAEGARFWRSLRELEGGFFERPGPLWRLSVPPGTPPLDLPGRQFLDWGGAQRWLTGEASEAAVRRAAGEAGGHATLFRGGDREAERFHPLAPPLMAIHRNLKRAFDPDAILNPGRLYGGL